MAIHDAAYATPAESVEQFRWRLQFLAEEGVGRRIREEGERERAAYGQLDDLMR